MTGRVSLNTLLPNLQRQDNNYIRSTTIAGENEYPDRTSPTASSIDAFVDYQLVDFGDGPFSYKLNPVDLNPYRRTYYLI